MSTPYRYRLAAFLLGTLSLFPATPVLTQNTGTALDALKNLPPEQREALMNQALGGNGKGGVDKQDRKLQFPETIQPRLAEDQEERKQTPFGEPLLRHDDTLILRLEIREFTGPDESAPTTAELAAQARFMQQVQPGQQTTVAQPQPQPSTALPSTLAPRTKIERTPEEIERLEELRDRIVRRNPYQLDKDGILTVPELGAIPLAGLTVEEARQRLAVEVALKDFRIDLTLLPLEPQGDEALKPFGYDLFAGSPSTFAPVDDVPVPSEYIVGPGDELNVSLYGNQNRNMNLVVGRDGRINFPELGPIAVGGQSFAQVKANLERQVANQMIGVRASVTMGDTRAIRIFVLGEAQRPGSYTVSGLSTMTGALFASGGVKGIGSLRNIQLKRNGQLVSRLDLYDLLLNGDTSGDKRLMPGDVIFIPPVGATVTATGEVRRPAIYELRGEATAKDLLQLAGGLKAESDPGIAKLERIDEQRRRIVLDVNLSDNTAGSPALRDGDLLRVHPIRTVTEDSVLLQGHVYRPGQFQYRQGLRLSDVISSFDELKPQADTHYILIRREIQPDHRIVVLSADLAKALQARGTQADIELKPKDRLTVFNLETSRDRIVQPLLDDLKLQSKVDQPLQAVGIGGRVKAPGQYPLEEGMRVSDLIRAGGSLDDAAYGGKAEIARYRVKNGENRETDLIDVDLAAVMKGDSTADIALEPYDFLTIKEVSQWNDQEEIEVVGEVRFPGKYPIQRGETLRSVLIRAGGLTDLAFPEGAVFAREDLKKREQQQLETLADRMQSDIAVLALQATQSTNTQSTQALAIGQSLMEQLRKAKAVGRLVVNMGNIIGQPPGSEYDVVLKDKDRLVIPRKTQEVTVLGEVQTVTSHLYRADLTRDDYLNLSGGPTRRGDAKHIYVVRADGSVVASGNSWFSRSSSEIRPGDSIVVPLDAERMRPLPLWTAVTQIIYQLAVAAAAVNSF